MSTKKAITFHPLDDDELMAAAGRMLVRHSNLDYQLKMTIRKLADVTPDEARKAFARTNSSELRKLVNTHAKRVLGNGSPELIKLQALLRECEDATEQRNEYVHVIWATEFGGEKHHLFGPDGKLKPFPTTGSLKKLDKEIARLVKALGDASQHFLHQAMQKKGTLKATDES